MERKNRKFKKNYKMKLSKNIGILKYRLNLRKELMQLDYDLLQVTKEELKREFDRRSKKK